MGAQIRDLVLFPDVINGAGVNDAGFTISNTTVSNYNIFAEATNSNIALVNYAITRCKTLEDFENILNNWHKIKKFSTINSNFAVLDANGKPAMYEAYTPIQGAKVIWEKFDPDEAYDEDGFVNSRPNSTPMLWSAACVLRHALRPCGGMRRELLRVPRRLVYLLWTPGRAGLQ